jgi:hypothetical protein
LRDVRARDDTRVLDASRADESWLALRSTHPKSSSNTLDARALTRNRNASSVEWRSAEKV